jgi:hypothetical protein
MEEFSNGYGCFWHLLMYRVMTWTGSCGWSRKAHAKRAFDECERAAHLLAMGAWVSAQGSGEDECHAMSMARA